MTEPDPAGKAPGPDGLRDSVNLYLKKLRKTATRILPGMKEHLKKIYREDTAEVLAEVPEKVWEEALERVREEALEKVREEALEKALEKVDFGGGVAVAE